MHCCYPGASFASLTLWLSISGVDEMHRSSTSWTLLLHFLHLLPYQLVIVAYCGSSEIEVHLNLEAKKGGTMEHYGLIGDFSLFLPSFLLISWASPKQSDALEEQLVVSKDQRHQVVKQDEVYFLDMCVHEPSICYNHQRLHHTQHHISTSSY